MQTFLHEEEEVLVLRVRTLLNTLIKICGVPSTHTPTGRRGREEAHTACSSGLADKLVSTHTHTHTRGHAHAHTVGFVYRAY